ncbi:hypothetical protein Esti_003125 [Eimeria stiedai]
MGTEDKEGTRPSDCAATSASAARGGELRRRRPSWRSSRVEPAEGSAPSIKSGRQLGSRTAKDSDGEGSSASKELKRGSLESASASQQPELASSDPARDEGSSSDESAGKQSARGDSSGRNADSPCTSSYRPAGSRLLIEVTPRIRKFLETHVPPKRRKAMNIQDRIDLDALQDMVQVANKKKPHPKINMADLVEDSQVVESIKPPKVSLDSLSFSERLRLMAEERRHQAAVRSLWKQAPDRQDTFADLNKSLAMGVNALLGLFLTFLGGYWAALYCGLENFQSRVVVGLVCSVVCLIVEVVLFVIHDERQRVRAKRGLVLGPSLRAL